MKAILCLPYPHANRGNLAALALAMPLSNQLDLTCLLLGSTEEPLTLPLPMPVVRLVHPSLADMDELTLGYVVAEVFQAEKADLLMFGDRVDAEGIGLLPAALAHQLQCPVYSHVASVQVGETGPNRLTLGIRAGGKNLQLATRPPAILVAARSVKAPPMGATSAAITTLDWATLALDPMKLVARPNRLGDLHPASHERVPAPLAAFRKILAG